ncbi:hypothetical protein N9E02_00835 [Ilumatobacteraceae bacterium]|jgi:hypothetical protein|nr:hypothetical protein [Ilumatobacteraceae bacterium]
MSDGPLSSDETVDQLPEDLDPAAFSGAYAFPDNSRRRTPAAIYLVSGGAAVVLSGLSSPRVNAGFLIAGLGLICFAIYGFIAGRSMKADERAALSAAQRVLGFPIGHASAQQVWHGVASRPTWRVLAYSAEEPPQRRALILVDAVSGEVLEHLLEDNPEQGAD